MKIDGYKIKITGVVQGVGFRPFVYNLAKALGLNGFVSNTGSGVVIVVEGDNEKLSIFLEKLKDEAPPLSDIKHVSVKKMKSAAYIDFSIKESAGSREQTVYISHDVSICIDCRRELFDVNNRRYLYPFINCTKCGPRFTIVTNIPYDRDNTTMIKYQMCDKCASEYMDPANRRYHAQPISCYDCGPRLSLIDKDGRNMNVKNPIEYARRLIMEGQIIAVKGLGGYHLVCDAKNPNSIINLRGRKARDDKPFALMARDCDTILKYCYMNETEKRLLESDKKPIVLLKKRGVNLLPDEIAPSNQYFGIMLPYTPVHLLLFGQSMAKENESTDCKRHGTLDILVATSGNKSDEPIFFRDDEVIANLCDIADFFLINDREIFIRTDDSVTRAFKNKEFIIRRARGYVPAPVTCSFLNWIGMENKNDITGETLQHSKIPSVLACGGELKNTFCINKGAEFYLSHHIGDLENLETLKSFEEGIEHYKNIFDIDYGIIAYDLHPDYLSTQYALSQKIKITVPVQHHHAHIASCMAENALNEDVIGVAFDGTGYGEDGNIWGGEFFAGNYKNFIRMGHLDYTRMPGGEAAIIEPWRMAVSYLHGIYGKLADKKSFNMGVEINGNKFFNDIETEKINIAEEMLEKGFNSPLTSSMGRLFDAVSAILGIREKINYEGQAAIELEYLAEENCQDSYEFLLKDEDDVFKICTNDIIKGIVSDCIHNKDRGEVASKFHETVAEMVLAGCRRVRDKKLIKTVVLSGGVFQNFHLLENCITKLECEQFKVYFHSRVPTNDGGISLGQAVIALAKTMVKG